MKKINIAKTNISIFNKNQEDYISLSDIAKYKNKNRSDYIIQNWMRNKDTIEFLGLWEKINNYDFKSIEFDGFKNKAGANRFSLTPNKWIKTTNSIGIISKQGRYGGTYAHKDIAFEFASWISAEFKLYLIKEFQRLKNEESKTKNLDWSAKRMLTKINYKIHTDSIKKHILPKILNARKIQHTYANEADVLNTALFGMTAKEWKNKNPNLNGNIRDHVNIIHLICLANLESLNAEFIRQGFLQNKRLEKLNKIAIIQMNSLANTKIKI